MKTNDIPRDLPVEVSERTRFSFGPKQLAALVLTVGGLYQWNESLFDNVRSIRSDMNSGLKEVRNGIDDLRVEVARNSEIGVRRSEIEEFARLLKSENKGMVVPDFPFHPR